MYITRGNILDFWGYEKAGVVLLQCQDGNGDQIRRVIQFGYIAMKGLYVFIHLKGILGFKHCLFWRNEVLKMICRYNPPVFELAL